MLPTLFIPHGGGPLPILNYPCHTSMVGFLSKAARHVPQKPKGILLVSAHWEEEHPQLTSSTNPGLLYDYYGFPPETYSLQYPAPGDPQLAQQAAELLRGAGFKASLNPDRALDHGAFIPLKLMYPDADIPVVQLSLKHSLDPEEHYAMGEALAPLRSQGVLLLGSGMTFHSMSTLGRGMGQAPIPGQDRSKLPGQDFNTWLLDAVVQPPAQRRQLLSKWAAAPGARAAHPREEHLIPLMVVAGAASSSSSSSSSSGGEDAVGHVVWDGECMGAAVSAVGFGRLADEGKST
ncbi:hypothetical protein OEZ86_010245 [Tetradesmus obliquus]|nr:hypothetical protein OEZ86_010245 [Tetradesmus obliquus]